MDEKFSEKKKKGTEDHVISLKAQGQLLYRPFGENSKSLAFGSPTQ